MRPRDPERTRGAILSAAVDEFSEYGPAGARVDRVAAAAGVNKRMIYHYFGNKDGLWDALLAETLADSAGPPGTALRQRLLSGAQQIGARPAMTRLLGWEALGDRGEAIAADAIRAAAWQARVVELRQAQRDGTLNADVDAAQLELALTALQMFPHAFPQLTRMITGQSPTAVDFIEAQTALLTSFAAWLSEGHRDSDAASRGKPRLRRAASVSNASEV